MPGFLKGNVTDDNFVRGAGRLMYAPYAQPFPTKLGDMIRLSSAAGVPEVQTLTVTGTPTAGTYRLSFAGAVSSPIDFDASVADIQAALDSLITVGGGNVVAGGGPLPATPVTLTFAQPGDQGLFSVVDSTLAPGSAAVSQTTPGSAKYDAVNGWGDLGLTKTGIQITRNNAEETFDVDQIYGDIASMPTSWDMNVSTALAQVDLEHIQLAWMGGALSVQSNPDEGAVKALTLGMPLTYVTRRLAVLHQRSNGKIRAIVFRKAQRMPQESTMGFAKTGDQQTIPVQFRCLADTTVEDENSRFGTIFDQA